MIVTMILVAASGWSPELTTDALTDERTVSASVQTGGGFQGTGGLYIRCAEKRQVLDVVIATERFLSGDQVTVAYRFDGDPAVTQKWIASTTGTSAFARGGQWKFAERAAKASRVIVRVLDYRGTPFQYEFATGGDASAIRSVMSACSTRSPEALARYAAGAPQRSRDQAAARWTREAGSFPAQQVIDAKKIMAGNRAWSGPVDASGGPAFAKAVGQFTVRARFELCGTADAPEGFVCDTAPNLLDAMDVLRGMCPGQLGPRICGATRRAR